MTAPVHGSGSADRREPPLRLWPGLVAVALQWLLWLGVPAVWAGYEAGMISALGGLGGGLLVVGWWAVASRAPWSERLGAIVLMAVALAATYQILDESIATGGMGMTYFIYAVPTLSLAFVVWAVASRHLSRRPRRTTMVATILLACGGWALVRTGGVVGTSSLLAWRWSPTAEERLLARGVQPAAPATDPVASESGRVAAAWPGFRGPRRDGVVRGVRIATDWTASPPVELWRRPIGPGWSSFAVGGGRLYTQEQRGDEELVVCHDLATGAPLWRHGDEVRFWESNAGAGPRATPYLHDGRVYAFGATGILNALDAGDGSVVWSRDVAADTGAEVPYWGFAGSPLVAGDPVDLVVIVAAGARLAAYDLATGGRRWLGSRDGDGYSSPHRLSVDGVEQIVLFGGGAAIGVAPADGALLWEFPGSGIVQPALTENGGDVLISAVGMGGGIGMHRLAVTRNSGGWRVDERWTSRGLKPYFNDFVVHEGHAYGFDGSILACIDLDNGERAWKGGRYGNGQLVLLADQGVLLVLSERGELALVAATPERFEELARVPALEGKTWNHPVVVGDLLLVRNDREMAAFRLALADD